MTITEEVNNLAANTTALLSEVTMTHNHAKAAESKATTKAAEAAVSKIAAEKAEQTAKDHQHETKAMRDETQALRDSTKQIAGLDTVEQAVAGAVFDAMLPFANAATKNQHLLIAAHPLY